MFEQVVNAASFPGVTRVAVTPDCHVGYGVPIGTVIETEGVLLPTAAGYDIGCGMVQLQHDAHRRGRRGRGEAPAVDRRGDAAHRRRRGRLARAEAAQRRRSTFAEVVRHGAKALGRNATPPPSATSSRWRTTASTSRSAPWRSATSSAASAAATTSPRCRSTRRASVWVMLHTGSRGFGWNIAKHFFVARRRAAGALQGRSEDFIWLDADSPLGRDYWNLHNMAANFAVANRLLIGEAVCAALEDGLRRRRRRSITRSPTT